MPRNASASCSICSGSNVSRSTRPRAGRPLNVQRTMWRSFRPYEPALLKDIPCGAVSAANSSGNAGRSYSATTTPTGKYLTVSSSRDSSASVPDTMRAACGAGAASTTPSKPSCTSPSAVTTPVTRPPLPASAAIGVEVCVTCSAVTSRIQGPKPSPASWSNLSTTSARFEPRLPTWHSSGSAPFMRTVMWRMTSPQRAVPKYSGSVGSPVSAARSAKKGCPRNLLSSSCFTWLASFMNRTPPPTWARSISLVPRRKRIDGERNDSVRTLPRTSWPESGPKKSYRSWPRRASRSRKCV